MGQRTHFQGAVRSLCPVVWTAWILAACSAQAEAWRFQREGMGTRFTIVCCSGDHAAAQQAAEAAFDVAEEVNRVASDYRADSELASLSSVPAGSPVLLSPLLFGLLEHSRALAEATNGAFDPTLGQLTRLWRQTRQQRPHGRLGRRSRPPKHPQGPTRILIEQGPVL